MTNLEQLDIAIVGALCRGVVGIVRGRTITGMKILNSLPDSAYLSFDGLVDSYNIHCDCLPYKEMDIFLLSIDFCRKHGKLPDFEQINMFSKESDRIMKRADMLSEADEANRNGGFFLKEFSFKKMEAYILETI